MVYFRENPNLKWMMTGGTPILGNLHTIIKQHQSALVLLWLLATSPGQASVRPLLCVRCKGLASRPGRITMLPEWCYVLPCPAMLLQRLGKRATKNYYSCSLWLSQPMKPESHGSTTVALIPSEMVSPAMKNIGFGQAGSVHEIQMSRVCPQIGHFKDFQRAKIMVTEDHRIFSRTLFSDTKDLASTRRQCRTRTARHQHLI